MTRTLLLVLVLGSTSAAHAQKSDRPAAAEAIQKAKAHFDLQEYDLAEQALKEAYRVDPKPEILYAIAQAQRLGGHCDRAITTYKSFLRTKPTREQAKQAEENIARCEAERIEPPPPEPVPREPVPREPPPPEITPPSPTPAVELQGPVEQPETSGVPWTRNWVGHALVVGGLGLVAGGTYLALDGNRRIEAVNDAQFYDEFVARSGDLDAARTRRTIGWATAGTGGAMVLTGVLLYILRSPDERPRTSIAIGARGEVMFSWGL